ncbi:MAG TPA: hypothetical protein PKZ54_09195, partial [Syntrophorhabdaceae bacterium]|nr:hypothetical protein [Syntrophorhabdaceae bacterium]
QRISKTSEHQRMLLPRVVMVHHSWVLNWLSRIPGQKNTVYPHIVHSAFSLSCKKPVYEGYISIGRPVVYNLPDEGEIFCIIRMGFISFPFFLPLVYWFDLVTCNVSVIRFMG